MAAAATSAKHRPPPLIEPYPWLVFWHDKGCERQTFCTVTESGGLEVDRRRRTIPELQEKTIMCCNVGWLVLLDNKTKQYSLWNPSSLDFITLPPQTLIPEFALQTCVLTSPPHTANSKLLLFDKSDPNIVFIKLDCEDPQWVDRKFGEEMKSLEVWADPNYVSPFSKTCCSNGVVYMTTYSSHHLLALDTLFDGDLVNLESFIMKPMGGVIHSCCLKDYLVESQGDVFGIEIYLGGVRWEEVVGIEISRMNLENKEWETIESAKDRVFFLGDGSCDVCCGVSSSDPERAGHVFFTFYEQRLVYSYNIAEKSLSIAFRFQNLPTPLSTPAWVMPNHRLVGDQEKFNDENSRNDEIHEDEKRMVEAKYNSKESDGKDSKEIIDLLAFPQTVLEELSDHLVLLDYMKFRVVCRRFSMAAPAIRWRESSKIISSETCHLSPWLMFIGEDRKIYNLIDSKFSDRYFIRIPDELKDSRILHSKDGWLLMSKDQKSMFFFNPFTRVVLPCPDNFPVGVSFVGFVVSSVPTSSECLVVGITSLVQRVFIHILSYGRDEVWTSMEFQSESDFDSNNNSPVFWNGAFYFLGHKGNLGVLKPEGGNYIWNILETPEPPCESFNQNFLVECDEHLLSVFVGDYGKWVRVFRLDQSGQLWNEIHTLRNKTLYLSRSSSFSTVAISKEMENRIYFPRLRRESLVFYSLETQKLHSSNCLEDSLVDYCSSSEQLLCGWVEPRWL